jgi:hypothetical protein
MVQVVEHQGSELNSQFSGLLYIIQFQYSLILHHFHPIKVTPKEMPIRLLSDTHIDTWMFRYRDSQGTTECYMHAK